MIWATFHDVSCGAPAYTQTTEYGDMGVPGGANLHGAKDCWNMLKPQCVTDMKLCSSKPQKGKIFQMNIYWFPHRYSEVCCDRPGATQTGGLIVPFVVLSLLSASWQFVLVPLMLVNLRLRPFHSTWEVNKTNKKDRDEAIWKENSAVGAII
jgi:hypothetical protein